MSARIRNRQATEDSQVSSIRYAKTEEDYSVNIAICESYTATSTKLSEFSLKDFIHLTSSPVTATTKQGRGFIGGPCHPTRSKKNLPYATLAVIDADKRVLDSGEEVDGAPCPEEVHKALRQWGLSHVIYTTYSHGQKGNRYRIVVPVLLRNEQELAAIVTYYVSLLQDAKIPLALPTESLVWGQLWQLPKRRADNAPYYSSYFIGVVPEAADLGVYYGLLDQDGSPRADVRPSYQEYPQTDKPTLGVIGLFNRYYSSLDLLESWDYVFDGHGTVCNSDGTVEKTYRYSKPGSTSSGVVVFKGTDDIYRAYSHHANDPLCNGKANDAFGMLQVLSGLTYNEAMRSAVVMIQDAVVGSLEANFPTVLEGGSKFKVGHAIVDEFGANVFTYMDWSSFVMCMSNNHMVPYVSTTDDGQETIKFKNMADFWKDCNTRTMYKGMVYKPSVIGQEPEQPVYNHHKKSREPYFNTFAGWGITPTKGTWALLEWTLKYAICGGNEKDYNYLLKWFAHLAKFPNDKPGVALVLKGGKGWGKSTPFRMIAKALGSNVMILGNNEQFTGRFNSHIRTKLLLLVEESFWAGAHTQEGVLKHLISDPRTTFEKKGVEAVEGKSVTRVIMNTNDDWAAPATSDERRFFIPTLSDAAYRYDIKDGKKGHFFPHLINEMQDGGVEAFFHDLLDISVSFSDIVNVPETAALSEQRAMSLGALDSWVFSCLCNCEIRVGEDAVTWTSNGCYLPFSKVKESAIKEVSTYESRRNFDYRLSSMLRKIFQDLYSAEGSYRRLGPIEDCRKAFICYTKLNSNVFELHGSQPIELSGAPTNVIAMR